MNITHTFSNCMTTAREPATEETSDKCVAWLAADGDGDFDGGVTATLAEVTQNNVQLPRELLERRWSPQISSCDVACSK
jgi:hypothetical protein